jgi:hypothetical protein
MIPRRTLARTQKRKHRFLQVEFRDLGDLELAVREHEFAIERRTFALVSVTSQGQY